jgi:hypothetical protein
MFSQEDREIGRASTGEKRELGGSVPPSENALGFSLVRLAREPRNFSPSDLPVKISTDASAKTRLQRHGYSAETYGSCVRVGGAMLENQFIFPRGQPTGWSRALTPAGNSVIGDGR